MHPTPNWTLSGDTVSPATPGPAGETASAEHFELIRRMADDLAHELKNPLNSVVINLEVLRTRVTTGRTESALERIDVIESEVRRLHLLLDQMLRLIRPDHHGEDTFGVDEVLAEVSGLGAVLAKLAGRTFTLQLLGDDVHVRGVREPLRVALVMLAEAAIRAAPVDGTVRIHGAVADGTVQIHVDAPVPTAPALHRAAELFRQALPQSGIPLAEPEVTDTSRITLTLPRGD